MVHAFPAGVGELVRVDDGVVARLTKVAVPEAVLLFLPQLVLSSTFNLEKRLLLLAIVGCFAVVRWGIVVGSRVGRLELASTGSLLLLATIPVRH